MPSVLRVNHRDPFGLFKIDLSGLDADQRAQINALRKSSKTFAGWYDALDRIPADQLLLRVSTATGNWVDAVRSAGDGQTFRSGRFANIILSSTANWASEMEFHAVAAHEFAHAAAGVPGGTPAGCYGEGTTAQETCAVGQQNTVHREIGLRGRESYQDVGPFSKPKQPPP